MRSRIAATCSSACSRVIFSFLTRDPVWIFDTSSAFVRPWSTNFWSMSLRTTGMPAELMTWAISPPIVPAPTTAALVTNMAARLQGGLILRFCREAPESAFQSHCERPADEQHVGQAAQRAALGERVVQAQDHVGAVGGGFEAGALDRGHLVVVDVGRDDAVSGLTDALG